MIETFTDKVIRTDVILVIKPATSAFAERSSSKLRPVKTFMPYMRSVMNQERRLTELLTLAYERNLTDTIDTRKLADLWS